MRQAAPQSISLAMKIPNPIIERITNRPVQIGALILLAAEQQDGGGVPCAGTPFFGLQLPSFQRPLVWTEAQSVRFIESAYMGFELGTYVVNSVLSVTMNMDVAAKYDGLLIDGQQRINAIRGYVNNEFKVFGYLWSELDPGDQMRFRRVVFSRGEITTTDDAVLRELYNRLNFGGTAHTEDQRA